MFVHIISTDNYPLNVKLFKLFSPNIKLEYRVPHRCDIHRVLFLTFDFVHILKTIRNNWLNLKSDTKKFIYPNLVDIQIDYCSYPLRLCCASFDDIRTLYNSEKESLAKLAPRLTLKSCYPSSLERQNVKLVLKVIHESIVAALAIQNNQLRSAFNSNTSEFVDILLSLWKIFNVNVPYKHVRLNDPLSRPFIFNDERFSFLTRIVYWLEAWQSLPGKDGNLSKQTFTSLRHACLVLPQITNHLTAMCGYSYLLTSFLQTDPLEHHFGLYRVMSGANYHISYLQILESERRLKLSNILKLFSNQPDSANYSLQEFIQSFSSKEAAFSESCINLEPFFDEISDLSIIDCDTPTLQSLAFIAGYSTHQYLKRNQSCRLCLDVLTIDKDLVVDESLDSQYKLLELSDRGSLKYPSVVVLESIVNLWKIFSIIQKNSELMCALVEGPARKILVDLALSSIVDNLDCSVWSNTCPSCNVFGVSILRRLLFVAGNCLLANQVKNYNSVVVNKANEKRKLKKFNS